MKKLSIVLIIAVLLLNGCEGLQKEPVINSGKDTSLSFEQKQNKALNRVTATYTLPVQRGIDFRYAAGKATPGVVHIKSMYTVKADRQVPDLFRDFFGDDFWRQYFSPGNGTPPLQMGSASGVIVSDDGYIVTNYHVVEDTEKIEVVLNDRRSYTAAIAGTDPATDLALLKIEEKDLSFISFGNSDSLEVGDWVLAVGNPFNLASTVTAGIVSAKARNINILTDKAAVESYIQTDAAVNRGNSGGALVDINGRLVGINAAIATPTGVYAGYSFAIPIEIVKKTIDDLLKYGKILRGYLGVIISDMNGDKSKELNTSITTGVVVDSLQQNGAAMKAGVLPKDVITKIDGHVVSTGTELREIIARHRPGENLQLTIIRNGKEKMVPVTLLAPEEPALIAASETELLKILGIQIENITDNEKSRLKLSGGVKVVSIADGKIARNTSIRTGFIITKVNGKAVSNIDVFTRELAGKKGGVMLEGIYPGIAGVYYYAFGM